MKWGSKASVLYKIKSVNDSYNIKSTIQKSPFFGSILYKNFRQPLWEERGESSFPPMTFMSSAGSRAWKSHFFQCSRIGFVPKETHMGNTKPPSIHERFNMLFLFKHTRKPEVDNIAQLRSEVAVIKTIP